MSDKKAVSKASRAIQRVRNQEGELRGLAGIVIEDVERCVARLKQNLAHGAFISTQDLEERVRVLGAMQAKSSALIEAREAIAYELAGR